MGRKYLIDTCVWRDFYEDRISKSGRLLGKSASDFFSKIIKNKSTIIFSESLLHELRKDYDENEINDMLSLLILNKVLARVEMSEIALDATSLL